MDRDEALRLLRGGEEGIREWNRRRIEGENVPNIGKIDLSNTNLCACDLRHTRLNYCNISGADIRDANLCGADLYGTCLAGSILRDTNLHDADLRSTDLQNIDLSRAKLQNANLLDAKLQNANLRAANLRGANIRFADLRNANLSSADFRGADLRSAILRNANARGADFIYADLAEADLRHSDCTGAKISNANLRCANLGDATLLNANLDGTNLCDTKNRRADFSRSSLYDSDFADSVLYCVNFDNAVICKTKFSRADLRDAVFKNAICDKSSFQDVDLSLSRELETVVHRGPSGISTSTLVLSKGRIPVEFLKGCGLADWEIEAVKLYDPDLSNSDRSEIVNRIYSLQAHGVQFYSAFISYNHQNEDFANRLHADLQENGVRCWFAPKDLRIGDRIMHTIDEAIRMRDKLVIILSGHSIDSDWVEHEVNKALEEEERRGTTVLFPIRIDDAVMETEFDWAKRIRVAHKPDGRHIGDFRNWEDETKYKAAFERLRRDLTVERKKGSGEVEARP